MPSSNAIAASRAESGVGDKLSGFPMVKPRIWAQNSASRYECGFTERRIRDR